MKDSYGHFAVPAVFIGAIVVGALVYGNVFRHQAPPKWDEAQHMLFAWQIWADFTQGNIVKLLRDSHAQLYWSFLHSWWAAGFMTVFGVTDFGARISSFAAMMISVLLAFVAGKELYRERVPWAGLIAVGFLLMFSSLPGLASQCMIELLAVMLALAIVAMFVRPLGALAKPQVPTERQRIPAKIATYLADGLNDGKNVFVVGEFNALPAHLIAWELRKRGNGIPVHQSMDYKQELEGLSAFTPGAGDPADPAKLVALLKKLSVDAVITVGLKKTSQFHDEYYIAFNAWKQKYVDRFELVPEYSQIAARDFASMAVLVTIYRVR